MIRRWFSSGSTACGFSIDAQRRPFCSEGFPKSFCVAKRLRKRGLRVKGGRPVEETEFLVGLRGCRATGRDRTSRRRQEWFRQG